MVDPSLGLLDDQTQQYDLAVPTIPLLHIRMYAKGSPISPSKGVTELPRVHPLRLLL